jgi:hypothetical protein
MSESTIDYRLGATLCELIDRTDREIAVSDLLVKLLCGCLEPSADLREWCVEHGLDVPEVRGHQVVFRKVRPAAEIEVAGNPTAPVEFTGWLFQ